MCELNVVIMIKTDVCGWTHYDFQILKANVYLHVIYGADVYLQPYLNYRKKSHFWKAHSRKITYKFPSLSSGLNVPYRVSDSFPDPGKFRPHLYTPFHLSQFQYYPYFIHKYLHSWLYFPRSSLYAYRVGNLLTIRATIGSWGIILFHCVWIETVFPQRYVIANSNLANLND